MFQNRLKELRQVVYLFISSYIPVGNAIGMVEFQSFANQISPLTEIQGENERAALISKIPETAGGGTCIQCGVKEAISVSAPSFLCFYCAMLYRLQKKAFKTA